MRARRLATCSAGSLLAGACALIGPLTDPDMSGARRQACAAPTEVAAQCFALAVDGERADFASGPLHVAAGSELVAVPTGGPGCAGSFSHFAVTGASPSAGAMQVSMHDALARADAVRHFSWHRPVARRSWTVSGAGDPLLNPATMRIRIEQGELIAESLCLKSY